MTGLAILALVASATQAQDTVVLPPIVTVARHPDSAAALPLATAVLRVEPAWAVTGRSLADLLGRAPGLLIADRGNPSRDDAIAIRGVGARASFGVRGVRVLLDGVPQTLPDGQTQLSAIDPADLARVEILRGAASAWYGNAAGGALLFTSAPLRSGASADARIGGHETGRVAVSGTAGNGVRGIRGGLAREWGTGWRRHAAWDTWRASVSAATGLAGTRNTITLTITHQPELQDPGALTASQLSADPRQAAPLFLAANARKRVTHVQGGTGLAWRAGAANLQVAAWGQRRELQNPLPFVDITLNRTAGGARASADWVGARGFALGGGVEMQAMRDDRVNRDPGGTVVVRDQVERATETASWVQSRWRPHDAVSVLASARLDIVRFSATDRLLTDGDGSGDRTLTAPSVALAVAAAPAAAVRPWVGVSTIFETPTTTELANRADGGTGFNPDLDPERGVQAELGVRGDVANLTWEVVAWRAWVRDGLVPFESPLEPGRIVYRNAGRLRRNGVEVGATLRPVRLVLVETALTVNDYRYRTFSTTAGTFDGNRVPGVPVRHAVVRAVLGTDRLWLALDAQARSALIADDANMAVASAWTTAGARVGSRLAAGSLELVGWVALQNVFDARYVSAVQVNANGGRFYEPGAGRTLTLSLSVSRRPVARNSSGR